MKFKNYLGLLFIFIVSAINAQTIEIKGTVSDSKTKTGIPGANVSIKNSKKGVSSSLDGNYIIKANPNDIVVFSSIGFASQEVKVTKSQTLNMVLSEETNKLEEVVINVGYGTQKKKNITNAISTVRSEAFDDRPLYNVGQALQGNAAGVNVIQPSGKPGVGLDIRIRGLSSIFSGNNPMFVIDGVQTYDSSGISTDDIVDIQVLKDATATAIYGVNGSAGVIIITTKRGKANKNTFSFSSYLGSSEIVKNIDILNPDQYKTLMTSVSSGYVGYINDAKYAGINTNWRDLVFQTGIDKNYDFSYSGGTEEIKTFASLGYQDTKGIVSPSNFSRISGRLNLDVNALPWLKAHANMNLIRTVLNNTSDNNSANQGGVILSTLTTPSFLPVYADELVGGAVANGQLPGQFAANPVASLENPVSFQSRQEDNKTNRYLANIGFDVTLAKNLVWKPSSTVDHYKSFYQYFVDSYRSNYGRGEATAPANTKGIGREHTAVNENWNLEHTLNYAIKSGNHDVNLMVGSSLQKQRYDQLKIEGSGFATDLRQLDISQMMLINKQASDTIAREKNYISYFGRATYNFKEKYILNAVFRSSGASQLAKGHKWGYFPGVSAAWIVSNESFLKNSNSISEVKLRGGWGQSGNISSVSEYSSFGLLGDDHGTLQNYLNSDLTWETTSDLNVGLDLGFFNNRVKLTVDVFKKTTTDLFQRFQIFGIDYLYNSGKLENKGVELSLNTVNFKGDFNWNTNFNISFIKNKILEMGRYSKVAPNGYGGVNRIEKGVSLGNFYGYVVDQVNPNTGILEFKDLNGDGKISTNGDDQTTIGDAMPNYTFGLTNTFTYKGFSLDILTTGSQGNDIFNASRIDLEGMKDNKNQSTAVLDRWTTIGQITEVPKAGPSNFQGIAPTANSTRWIEDGSYIRIKAATLGYNFKKLFLGLSSLKLYATGQNLITWTKYSGFDPEVSAFGGNTGTGQGIDYGTYPQVRTFIFGLKAGF
jgi:TonB-linked SusC/RagA family outer membrane protein